MLGKLLKHEFKATARTFALLYGGLLILTLLNKLNLLTGTMGGLKESQLWNIISVVVMSVYAIMIMAIFFVTIIFIIMRFYKNLLGDEGYLSFTLPATVNQHLISKILVSSLWLLLSFIAIIISVIILVWNSGSIAIINSAWDKVMDYLQEDGSVLLVISGLAYFIVFIMTSAITLYASMAIGQLFLSHRIVGSVVGFFIIWATSRILNSIIILVTGMRNFNVLVNIDDSQVNIVWVKVILGQCMISLILGIIKYFVTKILLEKKLNLE